MINKYKFRVSQDTNFIEDKKKGTWKEITALTFIILPENITGENIPISVCDLLGYLVVIKLILQLKCNECLFCIEL